MAERQADFTRLKNEITIWQVLNHFGVEQGSLVQSKGNEHDYRGKCPFCASLKSFTVYEDKNTFKCFNKGCDKRGNIIEFVMAKKGLGLKASGVYLEDIFILHKETVAEYKPEKQVELMEIKSKSELSLAEKEFFIKIDIFTEGFFQRLDLLIEEVQTLVESVVKTDG